MLIESYHNNLQLESEREWSLRDIVLSTVVFQVWNTKKEGLGEVTSARFSSSEDCHRLSFQRPSHELKIRFEGSGVNVAFC